MIYPAACSDSQCTQQHKSFAGEKFHRGSLYVQVLRTCKNDRNEVTLLSYKTIYYLTNAQNQKKEALIRERVLDPLVKAQNSKRTSAIYFAITRTKHEFELIQKAASEEEVNLVSDGSLIETANEEGGSLLERIYEICAAALVDNPIKHPQ